MSQYFVDLRSYSEEEHDRIYQLLSDWAFMPPVWTGKPAQYIVYWDLTETIESITGIPSSCITRQF